jgi:Xaa-Pro aminopeptidase
METFFSPSEFAGRRRAIVDAIGPGACALVQGAGPVAGFEVFRQTNEFYYLTGISIPQAYVLIDGRMNTSTLYLPHRDPHLACEGDVLGAEDVDALKAISGVDAVYGLECMGAHLAEASTIYTPHNPAEGRLACQDTLRYAAKVLKTDPWDSAPSRENRLISLLKDRCLSVEVRDLSPILNRMRLIKSSSEVDLMRRAGVLCARAVVEAMQSTKPGVYEYQLGAVADYVYRVNGVLSEGYRPIIAGGDNIWFIHYYANNYCLRDGDLVLMDYAPDVANYTSDIGRMWPVNGRYSALQRELYGLVVEYHKAVLARLRPGVLPAQVLAEAADAMRPVIESTRFSKPIYKEAALRMLDFKGHLSHPVGMAVHDVGEYFDIPLQPGLVISIDPQMWVPEERLYIRVEDTIVITDERAEVLTSDAPLELDDVERAIAEPGLIQQFPMSMSC